MVFLLYKLYFLSPYPNPTPKPTPHKTFCIFTFSKKILWIICSMNYKLFSSWAPKTISPQGQKILVWLSLWECRENQVHTHTHTHVCFCELWGHFIDVMVFIMYKPYFISPQNLPLTGNFLHFYVLKKTHTVWFISLLKYGDMGKCPHKSPSPCNTYVIPMSLYKFVFSYVTKTRAHTHTHTHLYQGFCGSFHILKPNKSCLSFRYIFQI